METGEPVRPYSARRPTPAARPMPLVGPAALSPPSPADVTGLRAGAGGAGKPPAQFNRPQTTRSDRLKKDARAERGLRGEGFEPRPAAVQAAAPPAPPGLPARRGQCSVCAQWACPVPRGKGGASLPMRHRPCDADATGRLAKVEGAERGRACAWGPGPGPRPSEAQPALLCDVDVWRSPGADMLCRLGAGRLRRPRLAAPTPAGGGRCPQWARAVASGSAGGPGGPGGPGGWYEALAASAPVRGAEEMLLGLHAAAGLPWWACIGLGTVALRGAVTLPLAAYQHYILAKVENLQPEIKNIARHLNQEVAVRANQLKWSKRVARLTYLKNMRRLVSELYVRDNCHPFKATILVWIQFPMWIFMSVALRNFSTGAAHSEAGFSVQEQLATDGILWFPDLTALDSTWILPISVGVINLLIVEIFALQKIGMSRFQTYITYFVRAVSVLMIPVAATVPSSIVLYWLCSSLMGLSQNLLLRSPRFRQLCRTPLTKSDSDSPYKDLFAAFYTKFISRK